MSTRATYKFLGGLMHPDMTFYVHHDNYPSGAANYFKNAISYNGQRCNLAEAFFRANEKAELAFDHDDFGDTEYQYTYSECTGKVLVMTKQVLPYTESLWSVMFDGSLEKFIEKYGE